MKRRDFLKLSTATAGLIPLVNIPVGYAAADKPRLATDDPQAQALQYIETSEVEGQYCDNCIHASGDLSEDWVGCNLFPGKSVAAKGWCSVWAPR
ncbi:high-potential iron-sulfur protein [Marinimicrobium alkaliphilum]|uniref:high-potential iron-sulfur protein n=1 Tax=Marinimicrobium alkaliphilum TaxID=2202654 RepID=UPI000DB95071|nr:high-potential iron-sulfur protein [Marinimicrobium alkaliphilum]